MFALLVTLLAAPPERVVVVARQPEGKSFFSRVAESASTAIQVSGGTWSMPSNSTMRPSSSAVILIWHDSRELGRTS